VYRAPDGSLLAFGHIEQADPARYGWWGIGLAYSTDNGATFTRLGWVVGRHVKDTGGNTNIFGVPYVIKDGYFLLYYNDVSAPGASPQPAVARAPVADVLDAARHGTVSAWPKYYQGGWTEPGLNGNASPIIPDGVWYSTHGDAAYGTYLGKYLLTGNTGQLGKGVFLAFSDDGLRFDAPSWIQSSDVSAKDVLSPYETIVNLDGTDNGAVGQSFYVYYGYRFKWASATRAEWPTLWRWLYRQKVTLNRAGFDKNTHSASTEFANKQGENGWHDLSYNGSTYHEMSWDSAQFRWADNAPDLFIDSTTQHPDGGMDAVRAWTAPRDGTVHIGATAGISAAGGTGADGAAVQIRRNGTPVWPASGYQPVPPGTTIAFDGLDLDVRAGDTPYFHANQNGASSSQRQQELTQRLHLPAGCLHRHTRWWR
jgi:hypothetical protein